MNAYKCPVAAAVRKPASFLGVAAIWVAALVMAGCGESRDAPPSVESQVAIENVAKWYQLYRAKNAGKQPADEDAFLSFINSKLVERGQKPVDRKELLTSPRDGEPYIICYGKVNARDQEHNLVAYEQKGANGTRLVVSELARSRTVDEAELQSLLPSK